MANRRSGGGAGSVILNALSLVIIILILGAVAVLIAAFVAPDLVQPVADFFGLGGEREPSEPAPVPTSAEMAAVPTSTPTEEGATDLEPTFTRPVGAATALPTATNTRQPTPIPSITPTFPPSTPTRTPTATPTETPTPGPSPTATGTRSPFPFTRSDGSPFYLQNYANNAGCNWLGIAGEVLDLNRNPVPTGQYQVHVWGSGIDQRVPVGGAPAYSPSGYEQFVFDAPVVRDYNVQLETVSGTAVSEAYPVQTRASCNQNLLRFDFWQNH